MRIFVTGASGWIGSAVVPELIAAGHSVVGLARSDASAARVTALGAEALHGDLADTHLLAEAAGKADGVIHLGYHHDFSQMTEAAAQDRAAVDAMAVELVGKPLMVASGLVGVRSENDRPETGDHPRVANTAAALGLADRGVRAVAVRFAPTVHGRGDHGFVAELARVARERGVSAYVDDGNAAWAAVHVSDAARLVRLALEGAAAGTAVHAVAEEGVPTRLIAEAIGRGLGLPVESVPADQAAARLGWIGTFFGMDLPASSDVTRAALGWEPTGPTLLEDLESGYYTAG